MRKTLSPATQSVLVFIGRMRSGRTQDPGYFGVSNSLKMPVHERRLLDAKHVTKHYSFSAPSRRVLREILTIWVNHVPRYSTANGAWLS